MENRYQCQDVSYKWIEWKVKSILEKDRLHTVDRDITHLCSSCKKIKDDMGFWNHIEAIIKEHTSSIYSLYMPRVCKKIYLESFQ